jgi:hypothetical protein
MTCLPRISRAPAASSSRSLILLLGSAFLLASCGGDRPGDEAPATSPPAGGAMALGGAVGEGGQGFGDLSSWDAWGDAGNVLGAAADTRVPVYRVVAEAGGFLGRDLVMEGTASRVCLHQGCWLSVDAGDDAVDVRIDVARDDDDVYRFTVPPDLVGRRVLVHGTLMRDEALEEEVEGDPTRRLRIVASSVLAEPGADPEPDTEPGADPESGPGR